MSCVCEPKWTCVCWLCVARSKRWTSWPIVLPFVNTNDKQPFVNSLWQRRQLSIVVRSFVIHLYRMLKHNSKCVSVALAMEIGARNRHIIACFSMAFRIPGESNEAVESLPWIGWRRKVENAVSVVGEVGSPVSLVRQEINAVSVVRNHGNAVSMVSDHTSAVWSAWRQSWWQCCVHCNTSTAWWWPAGSPKTPVPLSNATSILKWLAGKATLPSKYGSILHNHLGDWSREGWFV